MPSSTANLVQFRKPACSALLRSPVGPPRNTLACRLAQYRRPGGFARSPFDLHQQRGKNEEVGSQRECDDQCGEPAHPGVQLEAGKTDDHESRNEDKGCRKQGSANGAEGNPHGVGRITAQFAPCPPVLAEEVNGVSDNDSERHGGNHGQGDTDFPDQQTPDSKSQCTRCRVSDYSIMNRAFFPLSSRVLFLFDQGQSGTGFLSQAASFRSLACLVSFYQEALGAVWMPAISCWFDWLTARRRLPGTEEGGPRELAFAGPWASSTATFPDNTDRRGVC